MSVLYHNHLSGGKGQKHECRVVFKSGMVFMRSRRPKLIQLGYFKAPAAAWAPRRDIPPSPTFRFCSLHQCDRTDVERLPPLSDNNGNLLCNIYR